MLLSQTGFAIEHNWKDRRCDEATSCVFCDTISFDDTKEFIFDVFGNFARRRWWVSVFSVAQYSHLVYGRLVFVVENGSEKVKFDVAAELNNVAFATIQFTAGTVKKWTFAVFGSL